MVDARALTAALVVVAVVALGATAAGVDTLDPDTEQQPRQPPEQEPRQQPDRGDGFDPWCPGPLSNGPLLGATMLAIVTAGVLSYRRSGSVLVPALVATPTLLYLTVSCGSALPTIGPFLANVGRALGFLFGAPLVLAGALVLALGGALALLYVRDEVGSFSGSADDWTPEEGELSDLEAVGEAAGAAADRIETKADVTNEVYRAWAEMTRHLDVAHPDTTAPDEFAEAAVEAGMAAEDVETLTELFQDVRYGGADPDARAEAAVAALRRIERTYGGEGT